MRRVAILIILCAFVLRPVAHASSQQPPATPPTQRSVAHPGASEGSPSQELAETSREAAGEENAEFKYSASVRWFARLTGLGPVPAYWILLSLNFAVIAILIALIAKSKLPSFFRVRSQTIQMSMEEARRTSADAQARLSEIESRLGRIDTEISQMRAHAEAEGQREEERIRAAAEEDKMRILAAVDQELAASRRMAERSLKAYAANLAVELAERNIKIDPETDRRLVRRFAEDFGNNDGSA